MSFQKQESKEQLRTVKDSFRAEAKPDIQWPSARQEPKQEAKPEPVRTYEDDRPLPTLAKAAALAEERKKPETRSKTP